MKADKTEIKSRIKKILGDIRPDLKIDDCNEELTGNIYGFDEIDLVYTFLEVEKKFEIKIAIDDIADYQFNSIDKMCELVYKYINLKDTFIQS